jgi:nucleotide-binding universal stress UspA family protein
MKKILLAIDESTPGTTLMQQAASIARLDDSVVVGVFVQDTSLLDYYTVLGGEPNYYEHAYRVIKEEMNEEERKVVGLIDYFVDFCHSAGIRFKVHFDKGAPFEELVDESRFADLMLLSYRTYFASDNEGNHQELVKRLIARAHCPILLLPEQGYEIHTVLLCYDGEQASINAINSYAFRFEKAASRYKHILLRTFKTPEDRTELESGLEELLSLRFGTVEQIDLYGDPHEVLLHHASLNPGSMLVMGAYGHSALTRLFVTSTAEHVVKSGTVPAFVAH